MWRLDRYSAIGGTLFAGFCLFTVATPWWVSLSVLTAFMVCVSLYLSGHTWAERARTAWHIVAGIGVVVAMIAVLLIGLRLCLLVVGI